MKIVFSDPKLGRTAQMELAVDKATPLLNRKIGEMVDGSFMGLTGYKFKITGGSDKSGFPMDRSVEGTAKVKAMRMISKSGRQKGQYRRQSMRGNVVSADTEQVNMMVLEYGEKSPEELFPKKEKAKEAPKEEKAKA
ncbi:MAG: hypothetical protein LVQ95_00670 [Candidatus Micrarchaeales archaeon]|nr:hypothetical protein [Candidatus Micrarchaeales archaeon]